MSDTKHTPLPWSVNNRAASVIEDTKGRNVCVASTYGSNLNWEEDYAENEANRDFIIQACNTYYEREAKLSEAIALIGELREYAQTLRAFGKTSFNEKTWADLNERSEAIL